MDSPRVLRTPSGRPYAAITRADRVTLSTEGGARVALESHGLRLYTTPRPRDIPLHARGELVIAGVLQVAGTTPLGWTAGDGPRLRVAPPPDRRLRFASPPSADVACTELSLEPSYRDVPIADHALRARGPIAVAVSPGGPAVVTLHLRGPVDVKLIARSGRYARIAWPIADRALADATVIGWVDGALVGGRPTPRERLKGGGGYSGVGSSDWTGCNEVHPLLADAGRGPEPVGEILVGTRVKHGRRRGALVSVEIVGPSVRQVPSAVQPRGAVFLLAPEHAADCR